MAKHLHHAALDAAFAHVADRADLLVLCEGPPDGYAEAATPKSQGGRRLGGLQMAIGLGEGDYAVAPGLVSGRRLVVSAQEGVPISEDGEADHVALLDTSAAEVVLLTSLRAPTPLSAGTAVFVESFDDEIQDPH